MCQYPMVGRLSWPWPCQLAVARGCSDVSHEPGCILGEISPRCLVAMAMQFVARLQIPHRFPVAMGSGPGMAGIAMETYSRMSWHGVCCQGVGAGEPGRGGLSHARVCA